MTEQGEERVVVYEAGDGAESGMLERVLVDAGVEATVVLLGDTAYPGITDKHRPYAQIRVPVDELERAQALLADYLEGEEGAVFTEEEGVVSDPAERPAPIRGATLLSVVIPIALLLSMAFNVVLVFVLLDPSAVPEDEEYYDLEGNLVQITYFENPEDSFPHRFEMYDRRGRLTQVSVDADVDGWIEHSTTLDLEDGSLLLEDADEDGIFERWTYEREDNQLLEATDDDRDGFIETIRCNHQGEPRQIVLDECGSWPE